jgi:hypothetical protein
MASEEYLTGGMGGIWVQPDGPGTEIIFLGCHGIDSIDAPQGDESPFFCADPASPKSFVAAGSSSSPPDMITFTIMERLTNALSELRGLTCPFPVYVTETLCGRKDVFENAAMMWVYNVRKITGRSISNPVQWDADDPIERSYDVSALPPEVEMREIAAVLDASGTSENLNDVTFCDDRQCADSCGSAVALGQNGIIVADEA